MVAKNPNFMSGRRAGGVPLERPGKAGVVFRLDGTNRRGHDVRVFAIDLHPHPKPDPARLEHTAAEAGSTEAGLDRLGEKPSALNEHRRLPGTEYSQLIERVMSTHPQPGERQKRMSSRKQGSQPCLLSEVRISPVFRMRVELERACKFMPLASSETTQA